MAEHVSRISLERMPPCGPLNPFSSPVARTIARATAIRVLGLMPDDAKARGLAEKALADDKPEVRSAAAAALGDMKSRTSIPKLKKALDDDDPSVALAAAVETAARYDWPAIGERFSEVLQWVAEKKSLAVRTIPARLAEKKA